MRYTEVGLQRIKSQTFSELIEPLDAAEAVMYAALLACADESGEVCTSVREIAAFVNANMQELTDMVATAALRKLASQ